MSRIPFESEDDAIQAFLIIGFVIYATVWTLMLLINFGNLKGNKIAIIASMVMTYIAGKI